MINTVPPGEDPDTGAVTLNSEQHHRLLGSGDMLGSRDNEDDYVTSIEFNECVERGGLLGYTRDYYSSHAVKQRNHLILVDN